MAITTFAAINIGSRQLSMKIFQVSKRTGIKELTFLRHKIKIGAETYTAGTLSHSLVEEICSVLNDFKKVMLEFDVTASSAYATSALREADNNLIILDQIKLHTGIKIKILSNSEQRFLHYKALALKEPYFRSMIEKGTLIVDAGAGSVQFSYFNEGALIFTQNLRLGSDRIAGLLGALEPDTYSYLDLISEYIEKDLLSLFQIYLKPHKIKNVIAVGEYIPEIFEKIKAELDDFTGLLSSKEFMRLPISSSKGTLILPTFLLYEKLISLIDNDYIYLSNVDLCDSMVAEFAEKREKIIPEHNFTKDIISAAIHMSKKYHTSMEHIENVHFLASEIFDRIRKLHGLGKRERLLLEIAVILHSVGSFINMNETRENSYKIIMSTEIIGLSHSERVMIANVVRYNGSAFPNYQDLSDEITHDEYITTVKLCALLRIANVLDKSNQQKIRKVRFTLKEDCLEIVADTIFDISLEKGLFQKKADIFQEVFGIRPVLRQKKGVPHGKI